MAPNIRSRLTVAAIAALVVAIFLVDLTTPLGLGVPFLYLLPTLIAIGTRQGKAVLLALAVACPLLAAAKLLAPPPDGVLAFGQGNRLIFSLLMWTLVGLELGRRQFEARLRAEREKFASDLERLVRERTEALHRANAELQSEVADRQQAERTAQDYATHAQYLAERLVEAQESERKRLAAELHDRIGQNLSALNLNLALNLAQLPADAAPSVAARIRDSQALLEQTTEMVRGVMEELHPALLDQYGLGTALRWYGEGFAERTGIALRLDAPETFPRLRPKAETTLFRIAQEALTNVAKHARARQVLISLARTPAGIEFKVVDDGVGIDPDTARRPPIGSGWGLPLMAERARALGAEWLIEAPPQGGTCIRVRLADGLWEPEK